MLFAHHCEALRDFPPYIPRYIPRRNFGIPPIVPCAHARMLQLKAAALTNRTEVGMRQAGSRGSGLMAVAALGAVLLAWPIAGAAQLTGLVDTVTTPPADPATGTPDLVGTVLGTTTVLAGTGTLVGGTSDALQASELAGDIPSLLRGEVLHAVTIGWPDQVA